MYDAHAARHLGSAVRPGLGSRWVCPSAHPRKSSNLPPRRRPPRGRGLSCLASRRSVWSRNNICFFFAPMLLSSSRFQQVLGVTPCPQTETCHPEDIRLVPKVAGAMRMYEGSQRKLLTGGKEQGNVAAALRLDAGLASKKRRSAIINQMVSSRFRYVPNKGHASFPAQSPGGRSCSKIFLLSSTEV